MYGNDRARSWRYGSLHFVWIKRQGSRLDVREYGCGTTMSDCESGCCCAEGCRNDFISRADAESTQAKSQRVHSIGDAYRVWTLASGGKRLFKSANLRSQDVVTRRENAVNNGEKFIAQFIAIFTAKILKRDAPIHEGTPCHYEEQTGRVIDLVGIHPGTLVEKRGVQYSAQWLFINGEGQVLRTGRERADRTDDDVE